MTSGYTGIGTAIWPAMGEYGHASVWSRALAVEAERRVGIEEAVGEEAHMERAAEMGEHCTQALGIDNMAGKITEFLADAHELAAQTCGGRTSWRQTAPDCFLVMLDNVVELAECTFLLDFAAEARRDRPGIALEHGDRSMLVLNLACDGAEWAVRDVPGEFPPKLSRREPPWSVLDTGNYRSTGREPNDYPQCDRLRPCFRQGRGSLAGRGGSDTS